jgi:hypothetical protein
MLAATASDNPWAALVAGFVLLGLAPLWYRYIPNLQQHVRDTYSFKERPSKDEFQRIAGTIFFSVVGLIAIISGTVHLL